MPVENDFVAFAIGSGANVESQATYLADPALTNGQQPGLASSALNNKALRQATTIANVIAQFIANQTGQNVLDNGIPATILTNLITALVPAKNIKTETSAYTAVINDYIKCSNSSTSYAITLPTAVGCAGQSITIVRTDNAIGSPITVASTSAQTIGQYAGGVPTLITQGETWSFLSDGANWQITEHNSNTLPTNFTNVFLYSGGGGTKGTVATDQFQWWREGKYMHFNMTYAQSAVGSGANGTGDLQVQLPTNILMDSTYVTFNTTAGPNINYTAQSAYGNFWANAGGATSSDSGYIIPFDTSHFRVIAQSSKAIVQGSTSGYTLVGSTLSWHANGSIPIANWLP
jgi:hypothetical protein